MKHGLISLIQAYRRFVSPLLGRHCRFYPSCSEYAEQALDRKGVFSGMFLSFARVLRCNPLNSGGFDPVE